MRGSSPSTSPTVTVDASIKPAPSLTALTPSRVPAGAAAFTLAVDGSGFVAGSLVRWNGADRPTTFVGSTRVQAAIGAAEVAAVGTAQVTVFTPAPGGMQMTMEVTPGDAAGAEALSAFPVPVPLRAAGALPAGAFVLASADLAPYIDEL